MTRRPSTYVSAPARDIVNPAPLRAKLRLVRGGPYVAAEIRQGADGWRAIIDGKVMVHVADHPENCPEIMRIWTFARDCTPQEWRALNRPGRDVDVTAKVDLNNRKAIF